MQFRYEKKIWDTLNISSADVIRCVTAAIISSVYSAIPILFLSRVNMLTRDIDIGIVCPSVRLSATFRYCIETA